MSIATPISGAYEKMAGLVSKLEMEEVDQAGIQRRGNFRRVASLRNPV